MKIISFLIVFGMCTSFVCLDKRRGVTIEQYARHYTMDKMKDFKSGYKDRVWHCISKYSKQYQLCPYLLSRQIAVESDYYHTAKSSKGALGLGQIMPNHWGHVLYIVDDGKLGKYLLRKKKIDHSRYFLRVAYNVEATAIIMRSLINKHGNYATAYLYYGHTRKTAKKFIKNPYRTKYVRDILGAKR